MPRTRRPYSAEFRHRLVELVRGGQSPEELARKFEPSADAIRNWVVQAARDAGRRGDGLTTDEKDEVRRLRREVRVLREEREILRKAAAWFAKETTSIPSRDSSSRTGSAATASAFGRRWARSAMPTTMPSVKASSRPSSVRCSTATRSGRRPRRGASCSTTSKAGTTHDGATRRSAMSRRSRTSASMPPRPSGRRHPRKPGP